LELKIRKACSNVRADWTGREVIRTIGKVAAYSMQIHADGTDDKWLVVLGTFFASDVGACVQHANESMKMWIL